MTTYGTIPTSSSPYPSPNLEFISHAKSRIQSGLVSHQPWKTMLSIHSLSFPTSLTDAHLRIRTNLSFFRSNYAIVMLFILFVSLLWHPVSLIVFLVTMAAWLFLYFLRDAPLVVMERVIDDRVVLVVLAVLTVALLFLTEVTANIVVALAVGVVVVMVHTALRRTDDLAVDSGFDDEVSTRVVFNRGTGGLGERLPMKDAASASYSATI